MLFSLGKKFEARNDFLDEGFYPEVDFIDQGKINELGRKKGQTLEGKKLHKCFNSNFKQLKRLRITKQHDVFQFEKKSCLGFRQHNPMIKTKSRLFYMPMSIAETDKVHGFSVKNDVEINIFMKVR